MTAREPERIALCLSGGGFRATLFHLGGLLRLNELGWLQRLAAVSSISGGSIAGAWLCLNWPKLDFRDGRALNLDEVVIAPLRRFCLRDIDTLPTLANAVVSLWGGSHKLLQAVYARHLFGAARLGDLPECPRCEILGCNLETAGAVIFNRDGFSDSRLGDYADGGIPLAAAVAVSSAYPPYLAPFVLKTQPARWQVAADAEPHTSRQLSRLVLVDGGMLDPLGLRPVWGRHDVILFSDASQSRVVWRPGSVWLRQLSRTTLMQTCSNSRLVRRVIREVQERRLPGLPQGVYWANDSRIGDFQVGGLALTDSPATFELSRMRTRLATFNDMEQRALINWGYSLCDAAMRERLGLANEPPAKLPV